MDKLGYLIWVFNPIEYFQGIMKQWINKSILLFDDVWFLSCESLFSWVASLRQKDWYFSEGLILSEIYQIAEFFDHGSILFWGQSCYSLENNNFQRYVMVHFTFWWLNLLVKDLFFCCPNSLTTETLILYMTVICRQKKT